MDGNGARPARIVTVAATKGGVGKTTLAYELSAALGGVLVDLDWDSGGATRRWGFDPAARRRAPLLDALESAPEGRPPHAYRRKGHPALVPSHPGLSEAADGALDHGVIADALAAWAAAWGVGWVVVDTHPGINSITVGALAAADLIVVPAVLAPSELDALEGMLGDLAGGGYRLMITLNKLPAAPPRRLLARLEALVAAAGPAYGGGADLVVGPAVSHHGWIDRRARRSALVLQPAPGRRTELAAGELRRLADAVEGAARG
ncbi:MAG: ParA family protein [Acidimicrobiia bacterium]|jgi:chromosome partitioning protein|nr:ParA family protein [Acidimicrobiia bacterium]MCU0935169.1 ParA family protein [Gammaproteobacteria bacterium]